MQWMRASRNKGMVYWKYLEQEAEVEEMAGSILFITEVSDNAPRAREIDTFRPFFHRDFAGYSYLLFLPSGSSVKSSEKWLDGGLDAASMALAGLHA
jgi:hypothetical protein